MTNDTTYSAADDPIDVLLVEDNPGDVRLVREAVEVIESDITLSVIADGDTAVEEVLHPGTDQTHPDLVLLDLNLPGRDGCAVLKAIRADSDTRSLPVLMLSSSSSDDDVARCYEAKANAYLTKPWTLPDLCDLLEAVDTFWFENARLPPVPA